jgi:hypothetical protein
LICAAVPARSSARRQNDASAIDYSAAEAARATMMPSARLRVADDAITDIITIAD